MKENVRLQKQVEHLRVQMQQRTPAAGQPGERNEDVRAAELRQLRTQLAQTVAERDALSASLAHLKTQTQAQDTERDNAQRVLQHTVSALQSRLSMLRQHDAADSNQQHVPSGQVQALTEQLTATRATVAQLMTRNEGLEKQNASLSETVRGDAVRSQQTDTLREQLAGANKTASDLKAQLVTAQADKARDDEAQAERVAGLRAKGESLEKVNADLRARLAALQADRLHADKSRDQSVANMQALTKANAGLQEQVGAIASARDAAQKSAHEAAAALAAAQHQAQSDKTQADNAQAAQLARLQAQLREVTQSNTDLKTQLAARAGAAGAKPSGPVPDPAPTSAAAVDLTTPQAQQAYASGVMMAGLLRRTLALQTDLGEKPDTALLLAGVHDGVTGDVRLDKRVLTTQSEAVVARLSAREKAKYDSGLKRLEALTAKQTLLKRNGSMFFVQNRKGKQPIKEGMSLNISLRESTLSGRVLREGKPVQGKYSAQLPYPVQQALMLGGLGGSVDIYCFASDIYPPDNIPEGIFAYTLMKYTVKTAA
ncbi:MULTISPECIES: hypothetical protein [Serratia]|uniref:Uncharacterized protein n=1 Tax=Serratia ureilytica TaxID=300181 RepID=A0A9X9G078_9GAMM|nr:MULTISPECIES: hypothetical protein [Serratia]MBS3894526.1 hypothetical protein [Serratia marcescens]TXE22538.1 hypothetical protein FOT63_25505 [Serratia ureilytica]